MCSSLSISFTLKMKKFQTVEPNLSHVIPSKLYASRNRSVRCGKVGIAQGRSRYPPPPQPLGCGQTENITPVSYARGRQ